MTFTMSLNETHQDDLVSAGGCDGRLFVDDVAVVLGVDAARGGENENPVRSEVVADGVLNVGGVGGHDILCKAKEETVTRVITKPAFHLI